MDRTKGITKFILHNNEVVVYNNIECPFVWVVREKWEDIQAKYPDKDIGYHISLLLKYSQIIENLNPSIRFKIAKITSCYVVALLKKYKYAEYIQVICFNCGDIPEKKMKKCYGCKLAWYCCEDCHKADWKCHKRVCSSGI